MDFCIFLLELYFYIYLYIFFFFYSFMIFLTVFFRHPVSFLPKS